MQVEDGVQFALAMVLDETGAFWCHCPNGGLRVPRTAARLCALGVKRGVPDLLIFDAPLHPHAKGTAIELKRESGGRLLKEQEQWLTQLGARGWRCHVAAGLTAGLATLRAEGFEVDEAIERLEERFWFIRGECMVHEPPQGTKRRKSRKGTA